MTADHRRTGKPATHLDITALALGALNILAIAAIFSLILVKL